MLKYILLFKNSKILHTVASYYSELIKLHFPCFYQTASKMVEAFDANRGTFNSSEEKR